jgi:hypothetical protein
MAPFILRAGERDKKSIEMFFTNDTKHDPIYMLKGVVACITAIIMTIYLLLILYHAWIRLHPN